MVEIVIETNALIGIIIGAVGLGSAVFYNALKIKENTKSRYYQILKDLNQRFHEIQDIFDDETKFRMHVVNFALTTNQLIDLKIIPKKYVVPSFKFAFSDALWILNRMKNGVKEEEDSQDFIKFCKDNKIKETDPLVSIRTLSRKKS